MPSYNLTLTEVAIVTTWLGESYGFLDAALNQSNVSARDARVADPGLDVYEWIGSNVKHNDVEQSDWDGCARWWWILMHDQVNIPVPQRPPESVAWIAVLGEEDESIVRAWERADVLKRNEKPAKPMCDLDGVLTGTTVPPGSHLQHQQNIFGKVATVLGG